MDGEEWKAKREKNFWDGYVYMATKISSINENMQRLRYSRNKEGTKPSLLQNNVPLNKVKKKFWPFTHLVRIFLPFSLTPINLGNVPSGVTTDHNLPNKAPVEYRDIPYTIF